MTLFADVEIDAFGVALSGVELDDELVGRARGHLLGECVDAVAVERRARVRLQNEREFGDDGVERERVGQLDLSGGEAESVRALDEVVHEHVVGTLEEPVAAAVEGGDERVVRVARVDALHAGHFEAHAVLADAVAAQLTTLPCVCVFFERLDALPVVQEYGAVRRTLLNLVCQLVRFYFA